MLASWQELLKRIPRKVFTAGVVSALAVAGWDLIQIHSFTLAYICFIAAAFCGVGLWLTSAFLRRWEPKQVAKASKRKFKKDPVGQAKLARRNYWSLKYGMLAVIFVVLVAVLAWVYNRREEYELSLVYGILIPANDPLIHHSCGQVPQEALLIFLGGITSYTTEFPHTVIEVHGIPRLVLDRKPDNSVAISVDILDSDGKIIVELDENRFTVNPHNYFKLVRKDRSSLSVFDDYKNEVLTVRYLNERAIWMNGILRYPGAPPIVLRGAGGGGICFGENRVDIAVGGKE